MKNKKEQIADLLMWAVLVSSAIEENTPEKSWLYVSAWNCLSSVEMDEEGKPIKLDCQLLIKTHSVIGKQMVGLINEHQQDMDADMDGLMTEDQVLRTLQDMLETT